ncbi:hypothetical protein HN269_18655, partial [Acinetobacter baumannii]|uniref:hypothetical protein n=1 Tax=Acinetobacter baumannii TaxID=470 RepID=UPI00189B7436
HTGYFAEALVSAGSAPALRADADLPTNQEILQAAKQAYAGAQSAVDASVTALVACVQDASLANARAAIDAATWATGATDPTIADPFFASTEVATAEQAARSAGMVTYSVGVFSDQLPGAARGMIAIARPIVDGSPALLELQIDIWQHVVS